MKPDPSPTFENFPLLDSHLLQILCPISMASRRIDLN